MRVGSITFLILIFLLGGCTSNEEMVSDLDQLYREALSTWKTDSEKSLTQLNIVSDKSVNSGDYQLASRAFFLKHHIFTAQGLQEDRFKSLIKAQYYSDLSKDNRLQTQTYNALSYFYYSRGFWDKAEEYGWKAYEAVGDNTESDHYRFILFNLGGALTYQDKWEEASEIINKIPDSPVTRKNKLEWLSLNSYYLEDFDAALSMAQECLELCHETGEDATYILNTLGLIQDRIGNADLAANMYSASVASDPSFYLGIYNAGISYEAMGQLDSAVFYLEKLRNWEVASESNIGVLTSIHKGLNRLQNLYHDMGKVALARSVMLEAEALLEKQALTEAAQKQLEGIYDLDNLKEQAMTDLLEEQQQQSDTNRRMAILFAGLLAMVLIGFFAWAMSINRRKYSVANNELAADARDVIDFLSLQVTQIDLEPKARPRNNV
ncbi:MAG: hypothetical protein AAFQ98_11040 [Bacteroidota bacterium]